jgi:two-component system response regulator BaeR
VKVVLRRIAQQAGQITDIVPFQIDQEKQRICINEHKLDLTPTEYRLLCQLIEHPGRVYSRDQLLELCYQNEQQVFDRVIDSHIKNLRKKLSTYLPDKEVLHSVYGVGYRFEI